MDFEQLVAEYLEFRIPPYVRRQQTDIHLAAPARGNVISTITGVRRCGKTFRMYQLMDDLHKNGVPREHMFHFTFDDDRIAPIVEGTASQLLETYFKLVPTARDGCYLFLDEIQEAPGWSKFVRRVSEQCNVTMVLTGSSSKLLSRDIPSHLRGRSIAEDMWPLSFDEFCEFQGVDQIDHGGAYSARTASALKSAFDSYLEIGGFPAVQKIDSLLRTRFLQAYAEEILTKDVVERFESTSLRVAEMFARNALRSTGLTFSVNSQLKDIRRAGMSVSDQRLYSLLGDLEDSHLLFKVSDYSLSVKENPKSAYKVYSVDPGLALAVAPASHLDIGQRLETAVFIELKRLYGADRMRIISSYSGANCPEVDFVVGDVALGVQYQLIQVAAQLDGDSRDWSAEKRVGRELGNLDAAMRNTGLPESTIVTLREKRDVKTPNGTVHIVPAWEWFLGENGSCAPMS